MLKDDCRQDFQLGWEKALDSIRASLKGYPHMGGDMQIMGEVERLLSAERGIHLVHIKRLVKQLEKVDPQVKERQGLLEEALRLLGEMDRKLLIVSQTIPGSSAWASETHGKVEDLAVRAGKLGLLPEN